jgi:hypothetical protein
MFAEDYVPPALKAQVEAAANPQSAPPQAAPASKKPAAASAPPAPPPQPAPAPEPAAQPKKKGFFGGLLGGIQKEITSTLAEGLKSAGLNVETPAPAKKAPSIFSKNIELWNGISTNMTRAQAIAQMNEIMPNAEILNSNDGASVLFKSEYLIRFASYLYGKSFSYTPVFKNNLKTLFENETAEAIKLAGIAYYNERPVIVGLYYRLKDSDQCMKYYDEVTKLLNKRYGENKYLKDHRSHFRMYVWESRGKIIEHEDSGVFSFLVRYIDKDAYVEACRATSQRGEAKAAEVARQKQALKEAAEEQIRKNIIV